MCLTIDTDRKLQSSCAGPSNAGAIGKWEASHSYVMRDDHVDEASSWSMPTQIDLYRLSGGSIEAHIAKLLCLDRFAN